MASSIDDLALAYRTMAAPARPEDDPVSALFPDASSTTIQSSSIQRPQGKTIGIFRDWIDRAEPSVRATFDKTLEYYRSQKSYEIVDISIPCLTEGQRAHTITIMAEVASSIPPNQIRNLTPSSKILTSISTYQIKAQDLLAAQRLRNLLMSHLAYLYKTYPGLLIFTPTTPIPGWKIGSNADLSRGISDAKHSVRNMEYTFLANFTGCPAITCPAGYDEDSRSPIGVMAMGEWGAEEDLIAFARDGEGALDLQLDGSEVSSSSATKGLKVPSGKGSVWVDVVAEASAKKI